MIGEQTRSEAHALARDVFDQLAGTAAALRLDGRSPCPPWRASDVVRHVRTSDVDVHPLRALDVAPQEIRVVELAVHAWDLATAIGVSLRLPDPVVRAGLEVLEPLAAELAYAGGFGAGPIGAPATTDVQTWLLHLAGRRP